MADLDFDALRTFVTVVEQGSFTGAARRLFRTQAAITQRIQRLEEDVGRPMFRKSGRGKVLTEEGSRLLDYARRIVALHDEAITSMSEGKVTGEIRLGAPDDADTVLPTLLRHLSASFPGVRVLIHVARSAYLMQLLANGELDIALAAMNQPQIPRLRVTTSPTVWLAAADFKSSRREPVPLVMHDEPSLYRTLALEALRASSIPWRMSHISGSLTGIRAAVRAGLGVTARSIDLLEPSFRVLGSADGLPPLPDVSLYLYLGRGGSQSIAARIFESLGHRYAVA